MENLSANQIKIFIEILQICNACFEYKSSLDNNGSSCDTSLANASVANNDETTKDSYYIIRNLKVHQLDTGSINTTMSNSFFDINHQANRFSLTEEKLDVSIVNALSNKVKWRSNEQIYFTKNSDTQKGIF